MKQPDPELWQLTIDRPLTDLVDIEPLLEDFALTVTLSEAVDDGLMWRLEALFDGRPEDTILNSLPGDIDYTLALLEQRDWVSESQRLQPPVSAGRFYIHGSHDPRHVVISRHDLVIEAGRAFGTGLHETTFGCITAIDDLGKAHHFKNPIDVGCGSGVLALAMAKAWRKRILASDIDMDAVLVTKENARTNKLHPFIRTVHAVGMNAPQITKGAPYDLITANILARPLVNLAPSICKCLDKGGYLVLSGLLTKQENMVRAAYQCQGLSLRRRYRIGVWSTLVMRKGTKKGS